MKVNFFLNLGFTPSTFCAVVLICNFYVLCSIPFMHMTCVPTRAGLQNYTLGDPYDTWCTCINTKNEPITDLFMEIPIDTDRP